MPRLTAEQRGNLVRLTRDVILDVRRMVLAEGRLSPLSHWDTILDRARAAERQCESVAEWVTKLCRDLQLPSPSRSLCSSMDVLILAVAEVGDTAWLDLIAREYGLIFARAKLEAERRRDAAASEHRMNEEAALALLRRDGVEIDDAKKGA